MKSFIPEYTKRDHNGKLVLNEGYILAYHYQDGFCGRLLSIDLLIDRVSLKIAKAAKKNANRNKIRLAFFVYAFA